MKSRTGLAAALLCIGALAFVLYPSALRVYYRVAFVDQILIQSERHHISPHLVAAVIFVESRFRVEAVSKVGAVGLMQLMPETAAEISMKHGFGQVSRQELLSPDVNIRIGTAYLAELRNHFEHERDAIAAYNAGPTQVAQWKSEGIDSIPFPETEHFVEQVLRHRSRLLELYPEW